MGPSTSGSMRIAGSYTVADWQALRAKLLAAPPAAEWETAYHQFYRTRIDTRYLHPMASIAAFDNEEGDGFAMATLFCPLAEFLEACEQGHNFDVGCDPTKTAATYLYNAGQAKDYFKAFFKHPPFDKLVPAAYVDGFYRHVRCGLLHEARTKGGWMLSGELQPGVLIENKGGTILLYRRSLARALEEYFADYKRRLTSTQGLKDSFIRKFDVICNP